MSPLNGEAAGPQATASPLPRGLATSEAHARLLRFGPNSVADDGPHPLRGLLRKFWSPVPWMLEAAVLLQIALDKDIEAAIIAGLLLFNAVLGLLQEGRAQATLAALRSRLALNTSVRRDDEWQTLAAAQLVPGDIVKLSLGAVVPADVRIIGGDVLLDMSLLSGESVPVEAGAGSTSFAGALVRRGEAVAEVIATGARTRFGRTAELVRSAHVVSGQQKAVLRVVRNLALFNGCVMVLLAGFAIARHMPGAELVSLMLTAVLASIPVALPATFTLASALGAQSLAREGVLSTRLSAVDEVATMTVLCSDKTGTLTQNALAVSALRPEPACDPHQLLALAALASAEGGQDPVDLAIRRASPYAGSPGATGCVSFIPFDPATRTAMAIVVSADGSVLHVVKGAFAAIAALAQVPAPTALAANELERQGLRVLGVASGPPRDLRLRGLVALSDPPRDDAAVLIHELASLGVRTVMVTGDSPLTAVAVARSVGIAGDVCPPGPMPPTRQPDSFAVYAGVLPEGKYDLVRAFQASGATVGMCGDGANDAPALRQAQIGIAVSTATDVAKSAAGMVLTRPGLAGIVSAVREGRVAYQRILTYTLNSITKKIVTVLYLAVGILMTGHAILSPLLMIIVMIAGDFLAMSLTADRVRPSPFPNAWRIGRLTCAGVAMGLCQLLFCTGVLAAGQFALGLPMAMLPSLAFIALVFSSQSVVYAIRERGRLWHSRPGGWVLVSSVVDIAIGAGLACAGVAMAPLPLAVVAATLLAAAAFALALDAVKVRLFVLLAIN